MNYGRLLTDSWQFAWRNKILWLLGLVVGLGAIIGAVFRTAYSSQLTQFVDGPFWAVFDPVATVEPERLFSWLLSGAVLFFIVSTGYWLAATAAQGAIISAVIDETAGRSFSFRSSLRQGIGWLGRFIAIDALVFLPLFALALALMLLAMGGMLGTVYLALQGSGVEMITAVLVIGLACLLPLACLLVPVGWLTSIFRTLAFRDTAVRHPTGVRESIRHTWQVMRRQWVAVLILSLLLWGIQAAPGLLLSLLAIPLAAATAVSPVMARWLGWIVGLGAAAPIAILYAFIAVAWTKAYIELLPGYE
ncbi:MAG: hypothetical protein GY803_06710 [Chloroflexi bacterium]|nr:hypothetical protein [Chloroflexota bacterium]